MSGFHADGLGDYLDAIARRHRETLDALRQRRLLATGDEEQRIDAEIEAEIARYEGERRRATGCLF